MLLCELKYLKSRLPLKQTVLGFGILRKSSLGVLKIKKKMWAFMFNFSLRRLIKPKLPSLISLEYFKKNTER